MTLCLGSDRAGKEQIFISMTFGSHAVARRTVVTPGCGERVVRGGSYSSPSKNLRSAARDHNEPGFRQDDLGFRVVREY